VCVCVCVCVSPSQSFLSAFCPWPETSLSRSDVTL
jgi:hypothetical protein